jgi:hypothetical protein
LNLDAKENRCKILSVSEVKFVEKNSRFHANAVNEMGIFEKN